PRAAPHALRAADGGAGGGAPGVRGPHGRRAGGTRALLRRGNVTDPDRRDDRQIARGGPGAAERSPRQGRDGTADSPGGSPQLPPGVPGDPYSSPPCVPERTARGSRARRNAAPSQGLPALPGRPGKDAGDGATVARVRDGG